MDLAIPIYIGSMPLLGVPEMFTGADVAVSEN